MQSLRAKSYAYQTGMFEFSFATLDFACFWNSHIPSPNGTKALRAHIVVVTILEKENASNLLQHQHFRKSHWLHLQIPCYLNTAQKNESG